MNGMSIVVKNITRVVVPFIVVFGIYVALYGHLSPGGGFTGGVIIGVAGALIVLAFGMRGIRAILSEKTVTMADCGAAMAFLGIAMLGYLVGGFFLHWLGSGQPFTLISAGTIPLSNIAIGLKVGACMYAAFEALALFRPAPPTDGKHLSAYSDRQISED